MRSLQGIILAAFMAVGILTSGVQAEVAYTDALSREFSIYVPALSAPSSNDAVSREFSVYVPTLDAPVTTDAFSREFSIYVPPSPPVIVTDAVSREFSVLVNDPPRVEFAGGCPTNGLICSSSVTFSWVGTSVTSSSDTLLYSYQLDNAGWSEYSQATSADITLTEGQHKLEVIAKDETGLISSPTVCEFNVNSSAPAISNLIATPSATSAIISWTTDKVASSQVEYGLDTNYGSVTSIDQSLVLQHSVGVQGLTSGETYHYRVRSVDNCERETISPDSTFTVPHLPNLTVKDSITAPAEANNGETITVSWSVNNSGVTATGPWTDRAYISSDETLSADDTEISPVTIFSGTLNTDSSYSQPVSVSSELPVRLTTGDYWIIVAADNGNAIAESDETDNWRAKSIHINMLPQPDMQSTSPTGPASAIAGSSQVFSATITNSGACTLATSTWYDAIYISSDATMDSNDTRIGVASKSGIVATGGNYSTNISCTLPELDPRTEPYYLFAVADSTDSLYESNESNNTSSAIPITILAGIPDLSVISITAPSSAAPYGNIEVDWTVKNLGTGRPLAQWVDSIYLSEDDVYDANDIPLGGSGLHTSMLSAGQSYRDSLSVNLSGRNPGDYYLIVVSDSGNVISDGNRTDNTKATPLQITRLQSLVAAPDMDGSSISINEGESKEVIINLTNLADTTLTGITASVENASANLQVSTTEVNSLNPQESGQLACTITAMNASVINGGFDVKLIANEGVSATVHINVTVVPDLPLLVADPTTLNKSMLKGGQTLVEFSVTNKGSAAATGVSIDLPYVSWMSLSTPAQLGDIKPGESAKVVLSLMPGADVALGDYTGNLAINCHETGINVPFTFRAVASDTATLRVNVEDEYTYFAEGKPKVAEATVTITDPKDSTFKIEGQTDSTGVFTISSIKQGRYNMHVTAEDHGNWDGPIYVDASGGSTISTSALHATDTNSSSNSVAEVSAFIARELVKYTWTVIPTEIEDKYNITIEALFETHVPAPVVTVDPMNLDLSSLQYDAQGKAVVDYIITNHGWIAADGGKLTFGSNADYKITPLISDIGRVAANTSVVVPVVVERLDVMVTQSAVTVMSETADSNSSCCIKWNYDYYYICGVPVWRTVGACIATREGCGGPSNGSGSGDGGGGDSGCNCGPGGCKPTSVITYNQVIECDDCRLKSLRHALGCIPIIDTIMEPVNCILDGISEPDAFIHPCVETAVEELVTTLVPEAKILFQIVCIAKVSNEMFDCYQELNGPSAKARRLSKDYAVSGSFESQGSSVLADIQDYGAQADRIRSISRVFTVLYGSENWFTAAENESSILINWLGKFSLANDDSSDAGKVISADERVALLAEELPGSLDISKVKYFIERWNTTMDYWSRNINNTYEVPSGESLNFIAKDELVSAALYYKSMIGSGGIYPTDISVTMRNIIKRLEYEDWTR